MSHSARNGISDQETANNAGNCCSKASAELKLYQAFIFAVPILFTFILLLLFYLFYLRRRRVDWSSLRMRTSHSVPSSEASDDLSRCEMGLKKELREMLPIIVYKQSFSVNDTQCSVCLGDYQADDKLQQIPACGHTFHINCIDLWLAAHTTCPLCRQSLLPPKPSDETPDTQVETDNRFSNAQVVDDRSLDNGFQHTEDPETSQIPSEPGVKDEAVLASHEDERYNGPVEVNNSRRVSDET